MRLLSICFKIARELVGEVVAITKVIAGAPASSYLFWSGIMVLGTGIGFVMVALLESPPLALQSPLYQLVTPCLIGGYSLFVVGRVKISRAR